MKKLFLVLLIAVMLFTTCGCELFPTACLNHTDGNGDNACDKCGEYMPTQVCQHVDSNGDDVCDKCNESLVYNDDCAHADTNNDDKCDKCSVKLVVDITLLAINDLHGKFLATDKQSGVGGLSTYIEGQRQQNPNTVVFSSGDMWQGSAESGLTFGNIMTDWMSAMGFAFMTLGNHEFDWGGSYISQNQQIAQFPILAINVYNDDTNERADFCQPSTIVDFGAVQVGFIGAIGDCYDSIATDMRQGYYFKTGDQLSQLVKDEATSLRERGVDIVVLSIHDGSSGCPTELTKGYVDIVFEGHTHSSYTKQDSNGVWHAQGGGENSGMVNATLQYDLLTCSLKVNQPTVVSHSKYASYDQHPVVDQLLSKYDDKVATVNDVIGSNNTSLGSEKLSQTVAMLYAELSKTLGKGYDVVLGGGSINCRSPYNLYAGDVTYADLYMLFPFNNRLALCSIDGATLKRRFINGSYTVAYTEYGNSVKDSIKDNQTYYVITDSWNYGYAPNKMTVVKYYDEGVYARDLLADYAKQGGFGKKVDTSTLQYKTIAQMLEIGNSLSQGAETAETYVTSGVITSIANDIYGNMYIEDENGNSLYLYGLYDQSGNRYDALANKPKVGDTIYVYGKVKNYKGTIEIVNAVLTTNTNN